MWAYWTQETENVPSEENVNMESRGLRIVHIASFLEAYVFKFLSLLDSQSPYL